MTVVLLAHDETCVRSVLAEGLRRAGLAVLTAADGVAALDTAREAGPDLIVSHYRMPLLGGPELCARLLACPATRRIPVLLLAAPGITIAAHGARPANLRGMLTGPVTPGALLAAVRAILTPAFRPQAATV